MPKETPVKREFVTYQVADISTKHITETDGRLIGVRTAPYRIAETDDERGVIMYVPLNENETELEMEIELMRFGFSAAFLAIMKELRRRKIPYVRFDGDGTEVDWLMKFEW